MRLNVDTYTTLKNIAEDNCKILKAELTELSHQKRLLQESVVLSFVPDSRRKTVLRSCLTTRRKPTGCRTIIRL